MFMVPYDFDSSFFSTRHPISKFFDSMDFNSMSTKSFMSTDIMEKDGNYELVMDLPGFKKEDLKIELKDGHLEISASSNNEKEEKDNEGKYIRRERHSGSYARSFYVGENLKQEDIKAKFENGTLTLNFPKEAEKQQTSSYINIEG